jgi:hypothetical protein
VADVQHLVFSFIEKIFFDIYIYVSIVLTTVSLFFAVGASFTSTSALPFSLPPPRPFSFIGHLTQRAPSFATQYTEAFRRYDMGSSFSFSSSDPTRRVVAPCLCAGGHSVPPPHAISTSAETPYFQPISSFPVPALRSSSSSLLYSHFRTPSLPTRQFLPPPPPPHTFYLFCLFFLFLFERSRPPLFLEPEAAAAAAVAAATVPSAWDPGSTVDVLIT